MRSSSFCLQVKHRQRKAKQAMVNTELPSAPLAPPAPAPPQVHATGVRRAEIVQPPPEAPAPRPQEARAAPWARPSAGAGPAIQGPGVCIGAAWRCCGWLGLAMWPHRSGRCGAYRSGPGLCTQAAWRYYWWLVLAPWARSSADARLEGMC